MKARDWSSNGYSSELQKRGKNQQKKKNQKKNLENPLKGSAGSCWCPVLFSGVLCFPDGLISQTLMVLTGVLIPDAFDGSLMGSNS